MHTTCCPPPQLQLQLQSRKGEEEGEKGAGCIGCGKWDIDGLISIIDVRVARELFGLHSTSSLYFTFYCSSAACAAFGLRLPFVDQVTDWMSNYALIHCYYVLLSSVCLRSCSVVAYHSAYILIARVLSAAPALINYCRAIIMKQSFG